LEGLREKSQNCGTYLCDQRVTGLVERRVVICERVDGHEEHRHDGLGRRGHRVQYGVVNALWRQRIVIRQENHVISCGIKRFFVYSCYTYNINCKRFSVPAI